MKLTPLRALRLQRTQSLATVAKAVGISHGNLSRVETGKQRASPELAERLARYFGGVLTELQILYPERFQ